MKPRRDATGHSAGFTLLEVLIAVALLALALVPLLGSVNQSLRLADAAKMKTIATLLAREKMTRTELDGFPELGDTDGDFGEQAQAFRWKQSIVEPPPGLDPETVREVRLWVVWSEGRGERFYRLTNFIVQRNAALLQDQDEGDEPGDEEDGGGGGGSGLPGNRPGTTR